MKNIKIVFMVVLSAAVFVVFAAARFTIPGAPRKNFSNKDPDILPTLPVPQSSSAQVVFVPRVIDGDTIVVEPVDAATGVPGRQETVRYIGMDTPETVSPVKPVECYGHEASAHNKSLVAGKYVTLVKDVSDKDKYGRLLRFVYLLDATDTFINLDLVEGGFARVLTIPPDTEFEAKFKVAASAAQTAKLGFWGACAAYPF